MGAAPLRRKLAAILSADVEGYSRLMEDDDEATVADLTACLTVIGRTVETHRGRVVNAPGDNVLAEFASVVDAVRGAVEIQEKLGARNATLPDHRKMAFRIGINLGDVLEENGRLYGDGVNIAARVEALAEGGGICVSGAAYDQIKNKLSFALEYLGEYTVKNISEPLRVYHLLTGSEGAAPPSEGRGKAVPSQWKTQALTGAAALLIGLGGAAIWIVAHQDRTTPANSVPQETARTESLERPTVAVLPFTYVGEDARLEAFSAGLTAQIITTLSRSPDLFVAAQDALLPQEGKSMNVQSAARHPRARYVLEGSIQGSHGRMRITTQLVDTAMGHHLWADRYDRSIERAFDVQDEVALKVLWAVHRKLTTGEQVRLYEEGTDQIAAAEKCLEGFQYLSWGNREGNALAQQTFQKTMAIDPEYASLYMWLAYAHLMDAWYYWSESRDNSIERAETMLQKALDLGSGRPEIPAIFGMIYILRGQYDRAVEEAERAVAADPNSAQAHGLAAKIYNYAGRPGKALALAEKAIELDPLPSSDYFSSLGDAYRLTGRFAEAVEAYGKAVYRIPRFLPAHIGMASVYSSQERFDEAREAAAAVRRIEPTFSLKNFAGALPYKNQEDTDATLAALRKAGLE